RSVRKREPGQSPKTSTDAEGTCRSPQKCRGKAARTRTSCHEKKQRIKSIGVWHRQASLGIAWHRLMSPVARTKTGPILRRILSAVEICVSAARKGQGFAVAQIIYACDL